MTIVRKRNCGAEGKKGRRYDSIFGMDTKGKDHKKGNEGSIASAENETPDSQEKLTRQKEPSNC